MKARVLPHLSPCNVYVEQSATGKMFPPGTSVSTATVIPPMLYTYLRLHVALTRRTNARILGTSPKVVLFRLSGNIGHKNTFTCLLVFKGLMTKLQLCRTATSYTTSLNARCSTLDSCPHVCNVTTTRNLIQSLWECSQQSDDVWYRSVRVRDPDFEHDHATLVLQYYLSCINSCLSALGGGGWET
jgi:hypothetical protein